MHDIDDMMHPGQVSRFCSKFAGPLGSLVNPGEDPTAAARCGLQ